MPLSLESAVPPRSIPERIDAKPSGGGTSRLPSEKSEFASALDALGRRLDQGEAVMNRATRGDMGSLDAGALIAVQAGIYRYVEAVDLATRLIDRASNAVKTVLQSGHG